MSVLSTRMCDDPEGHDWKACPHTMTSRRTIGLTEVLGPDVVALGTEHTLGLLRQELAINPVCDSDGTAHMLPPECEFVVHVERGRGSLSGTVRVMREGGFIDLAADPREGDCYIAVLSSPDAELDDLLAYSPEWTSERVQERLTLLRAAA